MPAQALYLKYRPQSFDDVQGQDHIINTLKNAMVLNRVAHAYLFTGTRGTGKTSTARILAKAVNCLDPDVRKRPCNKCAICVAVNQERLLDLVEIDAASNTGVDNIRELRDKIDFRPNEARYKVYIIDEVHMLSNAAFNALLKTLEEPPPHVIFILATTEVNRVPATISSRCQRFDFKRASLQELMDQLGSIAGQEGMELEPAALELVARQANGSFRDGTSLLDQLTAYSGDTITLKHVQVLLGAASREIIYAIASAITTRDVGRGVEALDHAIDAGADPRQVSRDVVDYMRGVLMFTVKSDMMLNVGEEVRAEMRELGTQTTPEQVSRAIRLFSQATLDLRNSASPTLPLEMALVEATLEPAPVYVSAPAGQARGSSAPVAQLRAAGSAPPSLPRAATPPLPDDDVWSPSVVAPSAAAVSRPQKDVPVPPVTAARKGKERDVESGDEGESVKAGVVTLDWVKENWSGFLRGIERYNKNTKALLGNTYPLSIKDNLLTIAFDFPVLKQRAEGDKHLAAMESSLRDLFKTDLKVKCVVSPEALLQEEVKNDPLIRQGMDLGGKVKKPTRKE